MIATLVLFLTVFGACCVESVEALTIVLAAGTRSMPAALRGAAAGVLLLLVAGLAVGEPLVHLVPLDALRVVMGAGAIYIGSRWLLKAVLRASGRKALHDEDAVYAATAKRQDRGAFALALQGVVLEGIEVLMIVLTVGPSSHRVGLAAAAGLAAVAVVATVGVLVRRQLREVPENAMKLGVSVMLLSFGTFWFGEGVHLRWPGADLMVLALIAGFGLATGAAVCLLRPPVSMKAPGDPSARRRSE